MSKINTITLSNFKFFGKEETININGKHLLLYGENGSGKSSIFWGLYTLLEASMKKSTDIAKYFKPYQSSSESLVNIHAPQMSCVKTHTEHSNSYIQINTTDNVTYTLSLLNNAICGNLPVQESRKATDFINYQSIFKFQDFRNSESPNLYEVFECSILPYVNFGQFQFKGQTLSNAAAIWSTYKKGPGTTTNKKGDTILVYKNSQDYTDFLKLETHFNNEFGKLIDFINGDENANNNLRKLGYNFKFELRYNPPAHKKKDKIYEWTPFSVELVITEYNGIHIQIDRPHTFLNEAKMSALAIAIRLSIIDYRINAAVPDALKVLVLDDLMISLDMGNRDALMDLLLKDYSDKYQMLFFTHDRMLFEFVNYKIKQHKQNVNWLRKELYVGEDNITKQEYPVLLDSDTDISRAMKYYKNFDYPAAANYLRKAVESLVKDIFPPKLLLLDNGLAHDKLRNILECSVAFFKRIPNFDVNDLLLLIRNLNTLLNPLSHRTSEITIYKTELKEVFEIIDRLRLQIESMHIKEILPRMSMVYLYFKEDEQTTQKYQIELQEEMYTYLMGGNEKICQPNAKSLCSCTITSGTEGEFKKNERYKGTLEEICKRVHYFKGQRYSGNYLELYKDSQDTKLINIVRS